MDIVALTSVISSGVVAIAGLAFNYRSSAKQREQEARIAYEERTWEKKSDHYSAVIATTRRLLDRFAQHGTVARN